MLTSPKIEKLAFEGRCRFTVQWFGIGTAGTVTVPAGGFAIVRQILYRPFINPTTPSDLASPFVHQLTLTEQGSTDELQYIFRDTPNGGVGAIADYQKLSVGNSSEIIETWAVFKRNICIDLINAGIASKFTYAAPAPYTPQAQEKPAPLGFGVTIPIQPLIDINAAEYYLPQGEARPAAGVDYSLIGAGVRDRLRFDINGSRVIKPVETTTPGHDFQYPIIGLGMWVFNIPVSEYLNY